MAITMLCVLCYVFVHKFLFNAHFDLEPVYIIRKPIVHRIQWYILRREILSTFHTRVEYISHVMLPTEMNGAKMPKNARNHARNSPFPWGKRTHKCLAHPSHHAKRKLDRCTHFHTMMQQSPHWLQWDAQIHPKLPLPLWWSPPKSNTPIPIPTPLITPNIIRIQSAVLPQLTCADRQMGWTNVQ